MKTRIQSNISFSRTWASENGPMFGSLVKVRLGSVGSGTPCTDFPCMAAKDFQEALDDLKPALESICFHRSKYDLWKGRG